MTEDPRIPSNLSGTTLDLYKRWLAYKDRCASFAPTDPRSDRRDREVWSDRKRAEYRQTLDQCDRLADELFDATGGRYPVDHQRQ
jgi:hypothetical protein